MEEQENNLFIIDTEGDPSLEASKPNETKQNLKRNQIFKEQKVISKKRKQEKKQDYTLISKEERELEEAVLGDTAHSIEKLESNSLDVAKETNHEEEESALQETSVWNDQSSVWHPKAKTELKVDLYERELRKRFRQAHPADWATLPTEEEEDDEAILRSTSTLVSANVTRLPSGTIDITKLRDANQEDRSNHGGISTVRFHPNGQLFMTAGRDAYLKLFNIDGAKNPKLQAVKLTDMPIYGAEFTRDGEEIILTGKKKFCYSYNIAAAEVQKIPLYTLPGPSKVVEKFCLSPDNKYIAVLGQEGVHILHKQSKQFAFSLKGGDHEASACFSPDSNYLYTISNSGHVLKWDLGARKCVYKFLDDGVVHGTSLSISPDANYIASGDNSGVVNVYETSQFASKPTKPTVCRSLFNLTTSIDNIKFNSASQIMGIQSHSMTWGLRLVHIPSCTVFSNWPETASASAQSTLAIDFDFSPNSGMLAVGTNWGRVSLWRLNHYTSS